MLEKKKKHNQKTHKEKALSLMEVGKHSQRKGSRQGEGEKQCTLRKKCSYEEWGSVYYKDR